MPDLDARSFSPFIFGSILRWFQLIKFNVKVKVKSRVTSTTAVSDCKWWFQWTIYLPATFWKHEYIIKTTKIMKVEALNYIVLLKEEHKTN